MREVNNNPTGNPQNFPKAKIEKTGAPSEIAPVAFNDCATSKEIKALLNDPGMQSLVKTDNIKNDIQTLLQDPELVKSSEVLFDRAYNMFLQNGIEDPYEKASKFTDVFVKEFA